MSHPDHQTFLDAIDGLETVTLTFASKDDGGAQLTRTCAPLDYGPRTRAKDPVDCYHTSGTTTPTARPAHTSSACRPPRWS